MPRLSRLLSAATVLAGLVGLAGCSFDSMPGAPDADTPQEPPHKRVIFQPLNYDDLAGWDEDRMSAVLPALQRSCARLPAPAPASAGDAGTSEAAWHKACQAAPGAGSSVSDAAMRRYFETWFRPYAVLDGAAPQGLFTGYYAPELRGSRTRSARYSVPLFKRPDDLVLVDLGKWRDAYKGKRIAGRIEGARLQPYHGRAEIEAGALGDRAQPLVWVDDPIDAFFLHIQGSGRIAFNDGTAMRVGYDGHNGHIYFAIGRYLIEEGEIAREDISLQTIRAWLRRNPGRQEAVFNLNPSYIFFREIVGPGPIGAQGVALTPVRSLAVDRTVIPLGAPVWVDIDYDDGAGKTLRRLMIAQDTGGAIKGVVRGDVYWGHGAEAGARAGPMKARGRYFILLPHGVNLADRR